MNQILHINISHPQQDTLNFLKFWWFFEPRFLPLERQQKIDKPLRKIFKTFNDIKKSYYKLSDSKYSSINVKEDRL